MTHDQAERAAAAVGEQRAEAADRGEEQRPRDIGGFGLDELLHPPPGLINPREYPRIRVKAHKRLAGPLATLSFVGIALAFALTGTFRRHGGLWRPLLAILSVVALVALDLTLDSAAVRQNALIPFIYVRAVLPAVVCAVYLFGPALRDGMRLPGVVAGRVS